MFPDKGTLARELHHPRNKPREPQTWFTPHNRGGIRSQGGKDFISSTFTSLMTGEASIIPIL